MLFNWIPLMAILVMSRAIARMAKMAISALMATIVMDYGIFSMATRVIHLKSMKKVGQ